MQCVEIYYYRKIMDGDKFITRLAGISFCSCGNFYFFFSFLGWGETGPLGTSATNCPIMPVPDDRSVWSIWLNENWQGKTKYSE
jgi:hypothetical protein